MVEPNDLEDVIAHTFKKGEKIGIQEVCKRVGLKESSFRQYLVDRKAPIPDGRFRTKGPWWYEGTIAKWDYERKVARNSKFKDEHGIKAMVKREAYDAAATLIESGEWKVNPYAGLVLTGSINTTNGYLFTRFHHVNPEGVGEFYHVLHHRIVWEHRNGMYEPTRDDMPIDHMNRIRHDNRVANLRCLTQRENLLNRLKSEGDLGMFLELDDETWLVSPDVGR